ncbi:MAG: leucine-rich repeat domain-containing protein, partial [Pseudomonadales bacterium]|nr:leucine-rich repeat domain-containing protein [Pseudomonadales bacterium]
MSRFFLALLLLASLSACNKDPDGNIDSDGDGVINSEDAFPHNPLEIRDRDNDGVGDVADVFPDNALESFDSDNDGIGDNSDPDIDGDGLLNEVDEFRFIPLAEHAKIEPSDDADNSYIHNDQLCTVNFEDGQQGACIDRILLAEAIAASGDANFRQCLNTTLGDIRYADEVTHIYCPNRYIAEVSGLASFARLKFLNLGNNAITNIDVGNNPALKQLYLASNQLKGIDTSFNKQLEVLNLNHNLLNTIDIAANTQLTELHLNGNQLQEINVNSNEVLSQLFLRSNNLKLVDVDNNIFLKHLSLGDNN